MNRADKRYWLIMGTSLSYGLARFYEGYLYHTHNTISFWCFVIGLGFFAVNVLLVLDALRYRDGSQKVQVVTNVTIKKKRGLLK